MMDPIHRKVLANKTGLIMGSISNPTVLSGHLSQIFNTADREEIDARCRQSGATVATQTLLSLLEKRGRNAFPLLLNALRDPEIKQEDLATALEDEERKLRGDVAVAPRGRVQSLPPSNEESDDNGNAVYSTPEGNGYPVCSPPPPYSSPVGNGNGMYNFSQGQQSPVGKQPPVPDINSQAQQGQSPLTPGTLIKDIPFRLRNRIEQMMNQYDVRSHDWKGLAGAMNMSAGDVRQLENGENGKMKGLFEMMIHTKKTIDDLLALLKHDDVQRLDVIDEIVKECNLPKELLESESSEVQETASAAVASSVEEISRPTTKCKSLPFPRQESKEPEEFDTKPDARIPSQVEDNDSPKDKAQSDTKPDARIPSQVEDNDNPKDKAQIDTKPDAHVPHQVENDEPDVNSKPAFGLPHTISYDDDDVFESTGQEKVTKHALLLSCCENSKDDKMHDIELRNLGGVLEDSGWIVERYPKCKMSNLMQHVHLFLRNLRESGRFISFVYLVGSTVHINGENYLLPPDLRHPSSQADLIHNALNINWLVSQLSRNYMQVVIVDGALKDAITDVSIHGVLQGLAPMHPPPNAVIAFPCHPGYIRPEQERLEYIKSVVKNLQDTENMMLADLFHKVRGELKEKSPDVAACSLPVEFSLSSALPPLCINPEDNEGYEGIELQVPSGSKACHTIIISNSNYNGLSIKSNQCVKDCERLRMALLKGQWECDGEICNKSAKEIMDNLRQALNRLGDKDVVVMVYFMGITQKIMDCNYFIGKDFTVESADSLSSRVPLKWVLDLMCEKLRGPKILIVDDFSTTPEGLVQMTAPLDFIISLPKRDDSRHYEASFTSNFAGLLETNAGMLSLKEMVKKAASFDRHHLSSSLYIK